MRGWTRVVPGGERGADVGGASSPPLHTPGPEPDRAGCRCNPVDPERGTAKEPYLSVPDFQSTGSAPVRAGAGPMARRPTRHPRRLRLTTAPAAPRPRGSNTAVGGGPVSISMCQRRPLTGRPHQRVPDGDDPGGDVVLPGRDSRRHRVPGRGKRDPRPCALSEPGCVRQGQTGAALDSLPRAPDGSTGHCWHHAGRGPGREGPALLRPDAVGQVGTTSAAATLAGLAPRRRVHPCPRPPHGRPQGRPQARSVTNPPARPPRAPRDRYGDPRRGVGEGPTPPPPVGSFWPPAPRTGKPTPGLSV